MLSMSAHECPYSVIIVASGVVVLSGTVLLDGLGLTVRDTDSALILNGLEQARACAYTIEQDGLNRMGSRIYGSYGNHAS